MDMQKLKSPAVLIAALVFCNLLLAFGAAAQEIEESDEAGIALLQSERVWKVVERVGNERWEATWTLRSDGKTFDAHWVHHPGGESGDLRAFAKILSLKGQTIVIDRPGLGRYTGQLSSNRTRINGPMSWSQGTWEVRLESEALPGTVQPGAVSSGPARTASGGAAGSTRGTSSTAVTSVSLAGRKWQVVESAGSERWTAVWTVRSDGRSFDAVWTHSPGGDKGSLVNFARIASISGDQIKIDRPGLGTYIGVISKDRRRIQGKSSWSGGTWTATSIDPPLPQTLR